MIPASSLAELFVNRPPTPAQIPALESITEAMVKVAEDIDAILPESRFKALVFTKLEEASMWAKKAAVFTVTEAKAA
jgi:hypothetical protein